MAPCPRTMMFSSHMAGTYAPPAVDGPCTTATCGMPSADMTASLKKMRPPGVKIPACKGREAPLDALAQEEAATVLVAPPRLGGAALARARQARAQLGGEPAMVARVRLELRVAADPRGETSHRTHFGGRFSRNAAMPSCPSSPAR